MTVMPGHQLGERLRGAEYACIFQTLTDNLQADGHTIIEPAGNRCRWQAE
ncbi:hypothetical protein RM533_08685 [Croceicoccus sp. F390]|uniref:Uncharacterized protein n=1 Tax=Croceicoccus esteveae TaxID=3075597 RepID=A0ABU2ZJ73_9SPHN|nr:hypothetical protein [Croceicoccus sp. F390]MDT0576261.1 hypothetical protein [Croceicoccus sp. F390]